MSEFAREKVVYDCNVYLQYLLNRKGPSGRCVMLALDGAVNLFISDEILLELDELPEKKFCIEKGITSDVVSRFVEELLHRVIFINDVPKEFEHPIDPEDSCYVNLAIAAGAKLIISRDNHLLNLLNIAKPWASEFRRRYSEIRILQPEAFLDEWDAKS